MAAERFPLLGRLRGAIKKVKFLLSFDATRWIFSPSKSSSAAGSGRRLSFKDRPGLLDCIDGYDGPSFVVSRTSSSCSEMSRSLSSASATDSSPTDVDRRAEIFIANFHRHIQMERQVSLELRYCKGNGLERTRSN